MRTFDKVGEIVENHEKAEIDYMAGMKYKDIAEKYGTTINTVKSWKKRYSWDRKKGAHKTEKGRTQNKKVAPIPVERIDDGTKETLQNEDLTPEQQMFCVYYNRTFNATQSYFKAYGCSYEVALRAGPRLLGKDGVKKEIERLKEIKRQQAIASTDDLVEMNMRIAFADLGDYLSFGQEEREVMGAFGPITMKDEDGKEVPLKRTVNIVQLKDSSEVDTQLIQEIKEGKNGVSIKLADRGKALDWLTRYFNANPMDRHKQEYDRQKMELELLKLEMQVKSDETPEDAAEDNFLEALNASAKDVWSDE